MLPSPLHRKHPSQGLLVFCLAWCLAVLRAATSRGAWPPRPALLPPAAPSLDTQSRAPKSPFKSQSRRWTGVMLADWRHLWTESGTGVMIVCIAESGYQMLVHSIERSVHLHLVLGFSRGFSALIIFGNLTAQLCASVVLLTPALYLVTGAVAPSAIIVTTLWFEAFVFGDLTDHHTLLRASYLTCTLTMIALFRYDRQARNSQAQIPTHHALLQLESTVKGLCTRCHTGMVLPPLALLVFAWSLSANPFWATHGVVTEYYRGRCQAGLALGALMLTVAGQDTRAHVLIGEHLERAYDNFMRRKEDLLGQPRAVRWLGAKKAL